MKLLGDSIHLSTVLLVGLSVSGSVVVTFHAQQSTEDMADRSAELEANNDRLEAQLERARSMLRTRNATLRRLNESLRTREADLASLTDELREREATLESRTERLHAVERRLEASHRALRRTCMVLEEANVDEGGLDACASWDLR